MSVTHFRKLEVWKLSMQLAKDIYRLSEEFPDKHRYGLTSQLQRSAVSIPSNIAEGNGRGTTRDYARFVSIALGSAAELETQLLLARELGLAGSSSIDGLLEICDRVGQMLQRLKQALRRRIEGESRVPSPAPNKAMERETGKQGKNPGSRKSPTSPESRVPNNA